MTYDWDPDRDLDDDMEREANADRARDEQARHRGDFNEDES